MANVIISRRGGASTVRMDLLSGSKEMRNIRRGSVIVNIKHKHLRKLKIEHCNRHNIRGKKVRDGMGAERCKVN